MCLRRLCCNLRALPPSTQGLAASIGCIDASLSKASSSALAHHLAQRALLPQLAAAFLSLWAHHGRSPRLATPLLKTAEIFLFRAGCPYTLCS
jgi:hypothetical protein